MGRKTLDTRTVSRLINEKFHSSRDIVPLKRGDILRPSMFASQCAREEVICSSLNVIRKEEFVADARLTFAHGRALHNILQNEVLPELGVLFGSWRCTGCGWTVGGKEGLPLEERVVGRPEKCLTCDRKAESFIYRELYFANPEYSVAGHPDGFLRLPGEDGFGILEAKSISMKGAFEVKHSPKADHLIQAQMYLWLTGLKWSRIFYWNKGAYGVSALVEHRVEYDEDTVAEIKRQILGLWDGLESGKLPMRICESQHCERAIKCSSAAKCFEVDSFLPPSVANA
jgi:hypothetical protein